jgi:hypothetical protein
MLNLSVVFAFKHDAASIGEDLGFYNFVARQFNIRRQRIDQSVPVLVGSVRDQKIVLRSVSRATSRACSLRLLFCDACAETIVAASMSAPTDP